MNSKILLFCYLLYLLYVVNKYILTLTPSILIHSNYTADI